MHHHRMCPQCYCVLSSLCHSVLKMCSHSTVGNGLLVVGEVLQESLRTERMVIGSKVFEFDPMLLGKQVKLVFSN